MRSLLCLAPRLGGILLACVAAATLPAQENEIAAVSSRASPDYVRAKQPDGSFAVETYTFGPGGHWAGNAANPSIDKLTILDIGHIIAAPLASQNYIPSLDPKTTKLLIMVYWGTTRPPEHSSSSTGMQQGQLASSNLATAAASLKAATAGQAATAGRPGAVSNAAEQDAMEDASAALNSAINLIRMETKLRDRDNAANSRILGYDSWWAATDFAAGSQLGAQRIRRQDLMNELEDARYFVVLMAYDFPLMWKEKKSKLLWETRFSIRQRGNEFDKQLAAMAQQAAAQFGQDSHGVLHKPLPNVRVDLGEAKVLGTEPATK